MADRYNHTIRQVTAGGVVSTLAGLAGFPSSYDGLGDNARFNQPNGVAVDAAGNLYVPDIWNYAVRTISPGGAVNTYLGSLGQGGSADGTGSAARFYVPNGVAVDGSGNVFVADYYNCTIRKATPGGVVTTFAGTPQQSGSTDAVGSDARFGYPTSLAVDGAGNLYVADYGNHTIRKVTPAGAVTTFAGLAGTPGTADGIRSNARFNNPVGVAVDSLDNVYVADANNQAIRKITPAGWVSTIGGTAGLAGSADGLASAAGFNSPAGIAVDSAGNLYVGDASNNKVRKGSPYFGPVLVAQPRDQIVVTGDSATFAVPVIGATPMGYQWQFNGTSIQGAVASSLIVSNAQVASSGNYQVVITNLYGTTTSTVATLAVGIPPQLAAPPASQSVLVGVSAAFTVAATGTAPLTYQWLFSGTNLLDNDHVAGSWTNSLHISGVLTGDAGIYQVIVTNLFGAVTSAVATLSVISDAYLVGSNGAAQALFNTGPQVVGITYTIAAESAYLEQDFHLIRPDGGELPYPFYFTGPATFQPSTTHTWLWVWDGIDSIDVCGQWKMKVYAGGQLVATLPFLAVQPPAITAGPSNVFAISGSNATFMVSTTGYGPLSYQWQLNGTNIPGAVASSLIVSNAQIASSGNYQVVITNLYGAATSGLATLTVLSPPQILNQPASQAAGFGSGATFTVTATGTAPLGYQWLLNGTNLSDNGRIMGSHSINLTFTNVGATDAGDFQVLITNLYGSTTSFVAVLVIGSVEVWSGGSNGNWDTNTLNWSSSDNPAAYSQGNQVMFDDTLTGNTNVILTTALAPSGIIVNNSLSNYLFSGSGGITGSVGLYKTGLGTLKLAEIGGDSLSGGLVVKGGTLVLDNMYSTMSGGLVIGSAGAVQVGDNDAKGGLPAGTVALSGKLIYSRSDSLALTTVITGSGGGTLIKSNSNTLTVSRNNMGFTGAVAVAQGTLRIGVTSALGNGTNAPITVFSGATLDVNGIAGTNAVVISGAGVGGNGAVVNNNSASPIVPNLAFLTLAGDATIGGPYRWDLRPNSSNADVVGPSFASVSTGGNPYNLTKVGNSLVVIVSATVDPSLANVSVQGGNLLLEGDTTGFGNPTNTLTVFSNAALSFWNFTNRLNKVIVLNDGATIYNSSGATTISGPILLNTNVTGGPGSCTFSVGGSYLWTYYSEILQGPGTLVKLGSSPFYVSGANTYTGNTEVRAGTLSLFVSGSISNSQTLTVSAGATLDAASRTDKTLGLTSGQTLQGNGTVTGILIAGPGSTLMPGTNSSFIGALTVLSNVTLRGTTLMKLNPAGSTNDQLRAYGVGYGGTLVLTNISATPLAAGNSFRLFVATNYVGSFTALLPSIPGPGLGWNTNNLPVSGTLGVVAVSLPRPGIVGISLSGTNLVINGTNGLAGRPCYVLMSTNVSLPLNQWMPIATNLLSGSGSFTLTATNAVSAIAPQRFYLLQLQ